MPADSRYNRSIPGRPEPLRTPSNRLETPMNSIVYIVGLVVVVGAIIAFVF